MNDHFCTQITGAFGTLHCWTMKNDDIVGAFVLKFQIEFVIVSLNIDSFWLLSYLYEPFVDMAMFLDLADVWVINECFNRSITANGRHDLIQML